MALGYEGVVQLGTHYALGTGTSVPRARVRLESTSGYGGQIKLPVNEMGIGAPFNYDWTQYDGTLNFEVSKDLLTSEIKTWLFERQTAKEVFFASRKDNVQDFKKAYWNNINLSAGENSAVEGTVGFVALDRETYVWGEYYIDNKEGMGLLCPLAPGMPPPLNPGSALNRNPIPFWNTKVFVTPAGGASTQYNFANWSLDFSQEIVKFFGCTDAASVSDPLAQTPLYIAAGPMTVTFGGSYMEDFSKVVPPGFLGDILDQVIVHLNGEKITMNRLEATTENDDVQSGGNFTPLTVEYAAYELAA